MTADELQKWIDTATAGQVITYYTGFLGRDRFSGDIVTFKDENLYLEVPDIADLAEVAITAFDIGKVHLFQRKLAENRYDYIAMKRAK